MSGITLSQAESQLILWLAASEATATGQSYTIGSRSLTRVDADLILKMITFWEARVMRLSNGGGINVRFAEPAR